MICHRSTKEDVKSGVLKKGGKIVLFFVFIYLLAGCAWSLKTKHAINDGSIRLGMSKEDAIQVLGEGNFFKTEQLESGGVLEVRTYKDWVWVYSSFVVKYYWVAYVNNIVTGFGSAGTVRNIQCTTTYTGNTARTSCF